MAFSTKMSSAGPPGPMPSDQRFRSFAERFLIERAGTFRADHIAEDTWLCVQDAKRAYNMIAQAGRNGDLE